MGPAGGGDAGCERRGVWHDPARVERPARSAVRIRPPTPRARALLASSSAASRRPPVAARAAPPPREPGGALIVAERAGALLGSALVLFRADSRAARLYSIAVDRGARGLGLGARCSPAAERGARRARAPSMRLEVRPATRRVWPVPSGRLRAFARIERYYEDGAPAVRFPQVLAPIECAVRPVTRMSVRRPAALLFALVPSGLRRRGPAAGRPGPVAGPSPRGGPASLPGAVAVRLPRGRVLLAARRQPPSNQVLVLPQRGERLRARWFARRRGDV
jgi:GNAT superfamily N-acetyltransferase